MLHSACCGLQGKTKRRAIKMLQHLKKNEEVRREAGEKCCDISYSRRIANVLKCFCSLNSFRSKTEIPLLFLHVFIFYLFASINLRGKRWARHRGWITKCKSRWKIKSEMNSALQWIDNDAWTWADGRSQGMDSTFCLFHQWLKDLKTQFDCFAHCTHSESSRQTLFEVWVAHLPMKVCKFVIKSH